MPRMHRGTWLAASALARTAVSPWLPLPLPCCPAGVAVWQWQRSVRHASHSNSRVAPPYAVLTYNRYSSRSKSKSSIYILYTQTNTHTQIIVHTQLQPRAAQGAHPPASARRRPSRSLAPARKPVHAMAALRARPASASAAACRHTTCRRPQRVRAAQRALRPRAPIPTPRRCALSSIFPLQPTLKRAPHRHPPPLDPRWAPLRPPREICRRASTG
jgi:hypothetical protein